MDIRVQLAFLLFSYKALSLLTGLAMCYMGYRLFLADKSHPAGDLTLKGAKYALSVRGGAPGVFFSLFGTILVCFSIYRGLSFDLGPQVSPPETAPPIRVIPDLPPADLDKMGK